MSSYFLFILSTITLTALISSQLVQNENNWEIKHSDPDWAKSFLKRTKDEFEKNNFKFPEIVRHGHNIPPKNLNRFYLIEMGVLADASLIFPNNSSLNLTHSKKETISNIKNNRLIWRELDKYSYKWPENLLLPLPYYTNINGDLNEIWDRNEFNRGLIELPLTFSNICEDGSYEVDFSILDKLPNGALVSTYIHPTDQLIYLSDTIKYIKNNYNISFISAKDYLDLYLSYNPRPVLININLKKSYWAAYLNRNSFIPIIETNIIEFGNNGINIRSRVPPPYLGIIGDDKIIKCFNNSYDYVNTVRDNINIFKLKKLNKIAKVLHFFRPIIVQDNYRGYFA